MRPRNEKTKWINVKCGKCHRVNEYLKGLPFSQACSGCGTVLEA
jgi:ribosomal protein S27E